MPRGSARLLTAILALVALSLSTAPADARNKTAEKYMKLYRKADRVVDKERWDKALKLSDRMERVAPGASLHHTLRAKAHASLGNRDEAFALVETLIGLGWTDDEGLANFKELEPLRDDPRYATLSARAAEMGAAWKERQRKLHTVLPIVGAESFDNAEALVAAFQSRRDEVTMASIITPYAEYTRKLNELNDAEIASAGRYVADHPNAEDADDAGLAAVRAAARYKQWWAYLDGDAAIVLDNAGRFIKRWPDSEHRPEVELARAVATWKNYAEDDGDATLARRAKEAAPLFTAIAEDFADSPEATKARVWRMNVAMGLSDGLVTDEITELHGKIASTFEDDPELKRYAWEKASLAMFQINGRELFDAVDLDGNAWNWETMQGKVVLIDFWATWCGPCIADIPHIKETYDKYKEAGFTVVGVSLDSNGQQYFIEECENLGVVWPQVYSGKGWDTEIARNFSISGIPTPVLVDRDGKVVGVHGDVRGDKLMEEVARLIDATE